MSKLKFKKTGWFADEASARYEAEINENLKVTVNKCWYYEGFVFRFITKQGFDLAELNGDLLSTFWNKATKKQTIEHIYNMISDKELLLMLNKEAEVITNRYRIKKSYLAFKL